MSMAYRARAVIRALCVSSCLAVIPSYSASAAAPVDEPQSTVTILVDLSQTWHNDQSKKHNQSVLEVVSEATVELGKHYRPPTQVRVLPIGDASFGRPPLCDIIFDPKLISPLRTTGKVFQQEGPFKTELRSFCTAFVLSRPGEKFTDITGAINHAVRLAEQQPGTNHAIMILSDMVEEIPKVQPTQRLGPLSNFRVLIIYRTLDEDRRQPEKFIKRIDDWKTKLKTAGAARVEAVPDQGTNAKQIERLLSH